MHAGYENSYNEFPFGISLQTLHFLGMHFDTCPWSCDLSLCEALSLLDKVLEAFNAEIRSSNISCACINLIILASSLDVNLLQQFRGWQIQLGLSNTEYSSRLERLSQATSA